VGSNPAAGTSRRGRLRDVPAPGARLVGAARFDPRLAHHVSRSPD
jgi:hypothetical protein